ncbi:MAG: histidine phosphatase family protein [Bacteroidales bacterium]|nr:histidine phosphatase family protein [Bacteroidales bacterium]
MAHYKTLIIARHGKSDWDCGDLSDIDRPLKLRGVNDAYEMAARLKKRKIIPDLLISSPAARALHTAVIFTHEMEIPFSKLKVNEVLYFSTMEDIINLVKDTRDEIATLMIFGHNPTFTNFANNYVKNEIDNVPTAGIVILQFSCETWNDISKKNLHSEFFDYPKNK